MAAERLCYQIHFFPCLLCSFWCLLLSLIFCFLVGCGCWLFLLFWKIQPVTDTKSVTFTDNLFLAADIVIWLVTWNLCFELCSGGIISHFYCLYLIVLNSSFSFILFKEIHLPLVCRLEALLRWHLSALKKLSIFKLSCELTGNTTLTFFDDGEGSIKNQSQ